MRKRGRGDVSKRRVEILGEVINGWPLTSSCRVSNRGNSWEAEIVVSDVARKKYVHTSSTF